MNLVAAPRRRDVRADCTEEVKATDGTIARLALGFGRDWVARNYHYRKPSEWRFPARPRLSPPTPAGTLSATTAESPGLTSPDPSVPRDACQATSESPAGRPASDQMDHLHGLAPLLC